MLFMTGDWKLIWVAVGSIATVGILAFMAWAHFHPPSEEQSRSQLVVESENQVSIYVIDGATGLPFAQVDVYKLGPERLREWVDETDVDGQVVLEQDRKDVIVYEFLAKDGRTVTKPIAGAKSEVRVVLPPN
jgi:hypothetical protein